MYSKVEDINSTFRDSADKKVISMSLFSYNYFFLLKIYNTTLDVDPNSMYLDPQH